MTCVLPWPSSARVGVFTGPPPEPPSWTPKTRSCRYAQRKDRSAAPCSPVVPGNRRFCSCRADGPGDLDSPDSGLQPESPQQCLVAGLAAHGLQERVGLDEGHVQLVIERIFEPVKRLIVLATHGVHLGDFGRLS